MNVHRIVVIIGFMLLFIDQANAKGWLDISDLAQSELLLRLHDCPRESKWYMFNTSSGVSSVNKSNVELLLSGFKPIMILAGGGRNHELSYLWDGGFRRKVVLGGSDERNYLYRPRFPNDGSTVLANMIQMSTNAVVSYSCVSACAFRVQNSNLTVSKKNDSMITLSPLEVSELLFVLLGEEGCDAFRDMLSSGQMQYPVVLQTDIGRKLQLVMTQQSEYDRLLRKVRQATSLIRMMR